MPKFKVRPYENYLEMYKDSFEVKNVYPAGSIVEVADPSKDNQMNKLEPFEEPKVDNAPSGADAPADGAPSGAPPITDPPANTEHEDKESKRKKAQQALAGF